MAGVRELLTLREHLHSPLVFGGVCVAHHFSFLSCVFAFFVCHSPVLFVVPNVARHDTPLGTHYTNSEPNKSRLLLLNTVCLAGKE